ncbi:hypothetical protein DSO57_1007449 [Entomophthora muscae]|uniref:Uncharacterized protein n=1 Tax=Entomophthora muscae TaxID=34485 RepID=A0ACC2U5B9_9FUNG|nr:hypothetical protein DSO57_1007449 [Entomophthora muscae]
MFQQLTIIFLGLTAILASPTPVQEGTINRRFFGFPQMLTDKDMKEQPIGSNTQFTVTDPNTDSFGPETPPSVPFTPPSVPYTPPSVPYTPPSVPYTPPSAPYTPPSAPYTPPRASYTPPTLLVINPSQANSINSSPNQQEEDRELARRALARFFQHA